MALVLLALPAGAQAFTKGLWGPVYFNNINQFPMYKKLGVGIWQYYMYWNDIAPTRPASPTNPRDPAYQWPEVLQDAVNKARQSHIQVMVEVLFTPSWANGGRPPYWAPGNPKDFANFMTAASRKYPSIHLWQIWGEPNRVGNFQPEVHVSNYAGSLTRAQQTAPKLYARILDAAYGALKSVSKKNLVIGGSTFTGGDIVTKLWIRYMRLPNGRPPRMDLYGHNPFGWTKPRFGVRETSGGQVQFSDLPYLAKWIDKYLRKGMPIFISEWSVSTAPDQVFPWWVEPNIAAQWVSAARSSPATGNAFTRSATRSRSTTHPSSLAGCSPPRVRRSRPTTRSRAVSGRLRVLSVRAALGGDL